MLTAAQMERMAANRAEALRRRALRSASDAPSAQAGDVIDLTADDGQDVGKRSRQDLAEGEEPDGAAQQRGKRGKACIEEPGSTSTPSHPRLPPGSASTPSHPRPAPGSASTPSHLRPALPPMDRRRLFVDLDGVLADFDSGVLRVTGRQPHQQSPGDMWRKLQSARPPFFEGLGWTKDCGQKLWDNIAPFAPAVLTGLPRGTWAEPQKRKWCARFLGASVKVHCCASKDKKNYATSCLRFEKRQPVLIDDRLSNCDEWKQAGGTAIHHTCLAATLRQLRDLGYSVEELDSPGGR
jgi:hypothetical protein